MHGVGPQRLHGGAGTIDSRGKIRQVSMLHRVSLNDLGRDYSASANYALEIFGWVPSTLDAIDLHSLVPNFVK